jgi:hypothetical protein
MQGEGRDTHSCSRPNQKNKALPRTLPHCTKSLEGEDRQNFRNFCLDRIRAVAELDERFPDQLGRRLQDYLRRS